MPRIFTIDDLPKSPENDEIDSKQFQYRMGYRLGPCDENYKYTSFVLQILEYMFIFFRYFKRPTTNNIIYVHEDVNIHVDNKVLTCKAILDTGNEGITIVSDRALYKLGYNDSDFNSTRKLTVHGIGSSKEEMNTIYLQYRISDFMHEGYVGISAQNNEASRRYDMIISQKDISKMCHSGYTLSI